MCVCVWDLCLAQEAENSRHLPSRSRSLLSGNQGGENDWKIIGFLPDAESRVQQGATWIVPPGIWGWGQGGRAGQGPQTSLALRTKPKLEGGAGSTLCLCTGSWPPFLLPAPAGMCEHLIVPKNSPTVLGVGMRNLLGRVHLRHAPASELPTTLFPRAGAFLSHPPHTHTHLPWLPGPQNRL